VAAVATQRFPRQLIRKLESPDLPLGVLAASRELRVYLDAVDEQAILKARSLGASTKDIAEALGITRQAVYHRLDAIERRRAAGSMVVILDVEPEQTT
jgi:DNA-binding NarL/FixJ family response regulator